MLYLLSEKTHFCCTNLLLRELSGCLNIRKYDHQPLYYFILLLLYAIFNKVYEYSWDNYGIFCTFVQLHFVILYWLGLRYLIEGLILKYFNLYNIFRISIQSVFYFLWNNKRLPHQNKTTYFRKKYKVTTIKATKFFQNKRKSFFEIINKNRQAYTTNKRIMGELKGKFHGLAHYITS